MVDQNNERSKINNGSFLFLFLFHFSDSESDKKFPARNGRRKNVQDNNKYMQEYRKKY